MCRCRRAAHRPDGARRRRGFGQRHGRLRRRPRCRLRRSACPRLTRPARTSRSSSSASRPRSRSAPATSAAAGRAGGRRCSACRSSSRSSAWRRWSPPRSWRGRPLPAPGPAALAAVGGVVGVIGIVCLYHGLAVGRMGVVAPVTGVLAAIVPVAVGVLLEGMPPPLVVARDRLRDRRRSSSSRARPAGRAVDPASSSPSRPGSGSACSPSSSASSRAARCSGRWRSSRRPPRCCSSR